MSLCSFFACLYMLFGSCIVLISSYVLCAHSMPLLPSKSPSPLAPRLPPLIFIPLSRHPASEPAFRVLNFHKL
ncbi:hypothetical protein BC940DRAFT_307349 [Gongronella butleri]|nr:hypothetical protein BC940DRAFT_307349 [Gongronella butleri]